MDRGFRPFFRLLPAIELRGTYPVDDGAIVGQESVLGGLRVQKRLDRIRPYANILFGRGQMNYQNGGFVVIAQDFKYIQSTTSIISQGVSVELDATEHFGVVLDGQYEHWGIPFSTGANPAKPGGIFAKVGTVGVVYRFGWLEHGHPAP